MQLLLPPLGHVSQPQGPHTHRGSLSCPRMSWGSRAPWGEPRGRTRPAEGRRGHTAQQEGTWNKPGPDTQPPSPPGGPGSSCSVRPPRSTVQPEALRTGHQGGTDRRETHPWTPDTGPGSPASRVCDHPPKLPPSTHSHTPGAHQPSGQHGGGATLQTEDHPLPPPRVSCHTPPHAGGKTSGSLGDPAGTCAPRISHPTAVP